MRPGPKSKSVEAKKTAGTYRPSRHDAQQVVIAPTALPVMPDYLPDAAKAVWAEEIGRLVNSGTSEVDSSLFARYCCAEALVRKTFGEGGCPPVTILAEQRRTAEMLGIGGPASRANRTVATTPATNPFAALMSQ